jgi:hypothetical protein
MQPLLGGDGQAAFLGDRDEIAEMAQLHSMPPGYVGELTKSFSNKPALRK